MSVFRNLLMSLNGGEPTPPYTRLAYIGSNGTQYINTNYVQQSQKLKYEIKFSHNPSRNYEAAMGVFVNNPYRTTCSLFAQRSGFYGFYYFTGYDPSTASYLKNAVHEVKIEVEGSSNNNGTYKVTENGEVISTGNAVGEVLTGTNSKLYVFAQNGSGYVQNYSNLNLYYLKMYDDDVLVRDFIPVLDENDVPCLYDKVSQQYFYNSGTGVFSYGTL